MLSEDGRYALVFNGEIFNYIELRKELRTKGYRFHTDGDTEVLLNGFAEWGSKCVSRFNGDWAFAVYDVERQLLFCSRDRFGVKPLYYTVAEGRLIFSSEIKPIIDLYPELRRPNYGMIANYCRNGLGAQSEQTWFESIYRLPPAHNLHWRNGDISRDQYWTYPTEVNDSISMEEAAKTYRSIFDKAVQMRMRSDVPVGTTLSSGIDSSSIVSVLRRQYTGEHKTFTASFDSSEFDQKEKVVYRGDIEIDEARLVSRLADDLDLTPHFVTVRDHKFVSRLREVIYYLESGHSSPAVLPLLAVHELARDHVTVVMEGQGADELLGGYINNMLWPLILDLIRNGNVRQALRELRHFAEHYSISAASRQYVRLWNKRWIEYAYHLLTGLEKVWGPKLRGWRRINDYPEYLPDIDGEFNERLARNHAGGLVNLLHYGDAISMSQSLESRLPFLDVDLVEFVFSLPFDMKMRNGLGKYVHRIAMQDVVPEYIIANPMKFGFNTPLAKHFETVGAPTNEILLSKRCQERGLFRREGLESLIREEVRKHNRSTILFRLLSVELWFREFIDG